MAAPPVPIRTVPIRTATPSGVPLALPPGLSAPLAVVPPLPLSPALPAGPEHLLTGWGNYPAVRGAELTSEDLERSSVGASLARGLGRSYGDASLPLEGRLAVATPPANRFLAFDQSTGIMRVEAGVTLDDIARLLLPRGWFVPVTPGTKFVTVGGMVASDVHGKNHHVDGTFGGHVTLLRLRVADGRIVDCSPTVEPDLFRATLGGMGLTGHILEVTFKMVRVPSPWIWADSEGVPNIEAFIDALGKAAADWPMTMGWIDCVSRGRNLGRGVIFRGRWAEAHEAPAHPPRPKLKLTLPFQLPSFCINPTTTRVFNELYYRLHAGPKKGIVHPDSFFYPLDAIAHWNRGYGKAGFTQYQCVIPHESGRAAARRFMEAVASKGGASIVCVIKDCGAEGRGLLSFPKPGISIAIDFPVRPNTQALIDALNEIVLAEGGRIYLAKDAFTRKEHFVKMEPRLPAFQAIRRRWDPQGRLGSQLAARLLDDGAPSPFKHPTPSASAATSASSTGNAK
jgi:decaprenylphospho-beta-D-ribofuranose 2-oxidase